MILVNAKDIKKSFSDGILFDNVTFRIDSEDKIGLVGINGAGKSTLFKILTGETGYDSGEIYKSRELKIGYLDQYACHDSDKTVFEEIADVFSDIADIEKELERIGGDIEIKNGDVDALILRQNTLSERFSEMGGFFYKNRIRSALVGLGFSENEFDMPVRSLSGGQKTRLSLSKILLSDSDLLLLDEPTNHLDIDALEWLEDFLINYRGAVVMISHDRYFLDRVTNKTFEIDSGKLYQAVGNYSVYKEQKEVRKITEQRKYDNTMKEITRLEGVIEQQRRWNREKNIKTAESKQKVVDKLYSSLEKPEETLSETVFSFHALGGGGDEALVSEGLSKSFDNKRLFQNADLYIKRGEKVFLLGPNGCGKTTLLKILTGKLLPDSGNYKIGANTRFGYYDQIQENLDPEKTVIDELWDEYPKKTETEIRNALAVFLFRGEDVFKEIKKLSGGERARVELAKLIMKRVNLLIMDEPTNHMDIESKEALENALSAYDGTMLIVSHDRYFIDKLADKIYYMDKDGVSCYNGNYSYFKEKHSKAPETVTPKKAQTAAAMDYKEQKRLESEKRKRNTKIKKTEELIALLEEESKKIAAMLSDPEAAADYEKAMELSEKAARIEKEIEDNYRLWEELCSGEE